MIFVWFALLLPTITCTVYPDLTYSCNPSGIITVENPDQSRFSTAYAKTVDGSQICSVLTLMRRTIVISGCSISRNISLWLFEGSSLPEIITEDLNFYVIRCQQIPATGIYRKVTDKSWVTNYMSSSLLPSVTPRLGLNMQFQDKLSGVKRVSAYISEQLVWEMEGPEYYYIKPLNCTAASSTSSETKVIVLDGCSQDRHLLHHFERVPGQPHILHADLFAFRFADSTLVIFTCELLGCHNQSSLCDIDCPSGKRRRDVGILEDETFEESERDHGIENFIFRRSMTVKTESESMDSNDVGDVTGQVRVMLQILDPEVFSFQRGAATLQVINAVLMVLCVAVNILTWK